MNYVKKGAVTNGEGAVFEKVNKVTLEDAIGIFDETTYKKVVCDGYSLEFDDYLRIRKCNIK